MSGKKGMKKYPVGVRENIVERIHIGESQRELSREYGISRYAIQSWLKETELPKQRGRKPAHTLQEYKYENKRLKMENELYRDFILLTERK
jgi:transposase